MEEPTPSEPPVLPLPGPKISPRRGHKKSLRVSVATNEIRGLLASSESPLLSPQANRSHYASSVASGINDSLSEISELVGKPYQTGFNLATLMEVKRAFDAADKDGSGALDEEEFASVFQNVKSLRGSVSETKLKHLFMKVDADCGGTVDWDEFTNYILLQSMAQDDDDLNPKQMFVKHANNIPKRTATEPTHHDPVKSPRGGAETSSTEKTGGLDSEPTLMQSTGSTIQRMTYVHTLQSYATASQDGVIRLWDSKKLQPIKAVRNGSAWVTDIVSMALQPLAVFALDRSISFYDSNRPSLDLLGRVENLDNVPMSATWLRLQDNDKLLFGDDKGNIYSYTFDDQWGGDSTVVEVREKCLTGMSLSTPWHVHNEWITRLKYLAHTNSLITTSMDSTLAMLDLEKRKVKWSSQEHQKGIYGCDYCRNFNFIATCGLERHIGIWNPYTGKYIAGLHGHTSSVLDVVVNEVDNQLISLGADKVIKVWDVRNNKCIQTMVEKSPGAPSFSVLFYNKQRQSLVAAGSAMQQWLQKGAVETSRSVICTALYNPHFRELVVGEANFCITVWDVDNGERVFSFSEPDGKNTRLTAMAFDATGRRLLLACEDGSLHMWNFNNGARLKAFEGFGDAEISCVACLLEGKSMYAAAAGWNRKVCVWEDSSKASESLYRSMEGHSDDITSMAVCPPNSLATGSYDGKIILWKLDGVVKAVMKPSESDPKTAEEKGILELLHLPVHQALVSAGADGMLRFWRLSDFTQVLELPGRHGGEVGPLCTDQGNKVLYSCDASGCVKCWDLSLYYSRRESHPGGRTPTPPVVPPLPSIVTESFCFQAHDEHIVSLLFVDGPGANFVISVCVNGLSKIWTERGVLVGTFEEGPRWHLFQTETYIKTEPVYINPEPVSSERLKRGSKRGSRRSHDNLEPFVSASLSNFSVLLEEAEEKEPEDEDAHFKDKHWIHEQVAEVLGHGPPNRRKAAAFGQLQNTFERRLEVKELSPVESPLLSKGSKSSVKSSFRSPAKSRSSVSSVHHGKT